MKKIGLLILALLLFASPLVMATPVKSATLYYPTTSFTITKVEVYNNALVSNDQLWLINCTLGYPTANVPSIPIDDAFMFRITENTTLKGVGTAYGWFQNGYGHNEAQMGLASIYLPPADVATWSGNVTAYFEGNPTLTWDGGVIPQVNSSTIDWISTSSISATRNRLTTRLLFLAGQYETDWGGTTDLVVDTAAGQRLTADGEDYFTNTISNLRTICPDIFYQSMAPAEFPDDTLVLDYFAGGANTTLQVYGANWFAQTFTASDSYDISGVQVPVYRTGLPGDINFYLRATAVGGAPTGGNLATATYDGDTLTTDNSSEWIASAFTSDYTLTSGTTYAVIMAVPAGVLANRVNWMVNTSNEYAGGQEWTSINSGVAWPAPGVPANDCLFELLVRGGASVTLGERYSITLLGTTFDVSRISTNWGIGDIWVTSFVWLGITLALCIAVAFATGKFGFWYIILSFMAAIGWRAGFAATDLLVGNMVLSSLGIVYGIFWKRSY